MFSHSFAIFFYFLLDLWQNIRILNCRRELILLALNDSSEDISQNFATSGFRQFIHNDNMLERSNWSNLLPDKPNKFFLNILCFLPTFQHNKCNRYFPFEIINFGYDSNLRNFMMSQQLLLHLGSWESMSCCVYYIV